MGLFALPAFRIPANLLLFLLRATLLETKLVMIFLHFVASLRFKSRFLPFLVNRACHYIKCMLTFVKHFLNRRDPPGFVQPLRIPGRLISKRKRQPFY